MPQKIKSARSTNSQTGVFAAPTVGSESCDVRFLSVFVLISQADWYRQRERSSESNWSPAVALEFQTESRPILGSTNKRRVVWPSRWARPRIPAAERARRLASVRREQADSRSAES